MAAQVKVVCLIFLLHLAASNEVSSFKSSHFAQSHQFKNSIFNPVRKPSLANQPIQYLETPNFEIMLLSEENSNPTWRQYSELFQPKDLRNAPHIEVNYGNHESFPYPFINLDRSEVESVLASLGDKKHIIVLYPRNCKPHSSSLDEFENEFLPKLLQKLHSKRTEVDPVVDRILMLLDKEEQEMLEGLRKSFENPTISNVRPPMVEKRNPRPAVVSSPDGSTKIKTIKKDEPKMQLKDMLFQVPCNEGYVFLVQNQKNSMDPSSLNDLLLRVLKVVTKIA